MAAAPASSELLRGKDFRPSGLLRNGHAQTMLSSSPLRRLAQRRQRRRVRAHAEPVVLELARGIRLGGIFTPQRERAQARGLALLFHGWEGSTESSYLVQLAARLLDDGWDVFRLNFRDHGNTHHLNTALFHSCLLDEVVAASVEVQRRWRQPGTPMVLAGFSLGGNFALRVALAAPAAGLELDHTVAICPVIDPDANLVALERAPWVYRWYFMRRWRASLRHKRRLFPDQHFFEPRELRNGIRELTRILIERHTDFRSLADYLEGYSVAGRHLAALQVPTTILAARNDPIIPCADFDQLALPACVDLDVAECGGHCGFLMDWRFRSFIDAYVAARFNALVPS